MPPPDAGSDQPLPSTQTTKRTSFWTARLWQGMTFPIWLRLLTRHRFAISRSRRSIALRMGYFGIFNSGFGLYEKILYGQQINRANINHPPLFVIGHWRTGTTWLHELLSRDDRFTSPTTYQATTPHHFLLTQSWLPQLLGHMMPSHRPMDNMSAGWDKPQEDEFALCNMWAGSPYAKWAFPNQPDPYRKYLDVQKLSSWERRHWQRTFLRFLKLLQFDDPRRIVLKSPTHTARMGVLRELFPEAQFIHIVRDPHTVFASTLQLWKRLWDLMALQDPNYEGLEEFVLSTLVEMYDAFNRDRPHVPEANFCEVRYEDLRADVAGQLHHIYEQLDLGEFKQVEPKLHQYLNETKDFRTNTFKLEEQQRASVSKRWRSYFDQFGYEV